MKNNNNCGDLLDKSDDDLPVEKIILNEKEELDKKHMISFIESFKNKTQKEINDFLFDNKRRQKELKREILIHDKILEKIKSLEEKREAFKDKTLEILNFLKPNDNYIKYEGEDLDKTVECEIKSKIIFMIPKHKLSPIPVKNRNDNSFKIRKIKIVNKKVELDYIPENNPLNICATSLIEDKYIDIRKHFEKKMLSCISDINEPIKNDIIVEKIKPVKKKSFCEKYLSCLIGKKDKKYIDI